MEEKTILAGKEDSELWEAFRQGDQEAFSTIYKLYVHRLFAYGMHFSTDRELVKDVIQDLFVRMYHRKEKLQKTNNIKFYLLVALRNLMLNVLQKAPEKDPIENYASLFMADYSEIEFYIEEEERGRLEQHLDQVLKTLPPRQQLLIHYRFVEELDYQEIAVLMNMNYQSVRNLLHRSLKKIREEWGDWGMLCLWVWVTKINFR